MKKIFNKIVFTINFLLEIFPIISIILGGIIIFYTPLLNEKILYLKSNCENLVTVIITMTTVIDALIITSLSVFGSTNSYSVMLLSTVPVIKNKFFIYIYGTLFSSLAVFIFSIFVNEYISIYLYFILISLSFFIAYSHICIIMFKKNIENFTKEEEKNKKQSNALIIRVKTIETRLSKLIDLLNEIKNK